MCVFVLVNFFAPKTYQSELLPAASHSFSPIYIIVNVFIFVAINFCDLTKKDTFVGSLFHGSAFLILLTCAWALLSQGSDLIGY